MISFINFWLELSGAVFGCFCCFPICDDLIGGEKENFYHRVVEHKDIKKVVVILKSAVSSQRGQAADVLKQFNPFRVIWEDDRNVKVKVCLPKNIFLYWLLTENMFSSNINHNIMFI